MAAAVPPKWKCVALVVAVMPSKIAAAEGFGLGLLSILLVSAGGCSVSLGHDPHQLNNTCACQAPREAARHTQSPQYICLRSTILGIQKPVAAIDECARPMTSTNNVQWWQPIGNCAVEVASAHPKY